MQIRELRSRLASLYARRRYTLGGWGFLLFLVIVALWYQADEKVGQCNDQGGSASVSAGTSGIQVECRLPQDYETIQR